MSYNRYNKFTKDGCVGLVPFIKVPVQSTDVYITYNKKKDRLDKLSYTYYQNPDYGWLILQANPGLGSMEFNIEDGSRMRIPYPLDTALEEYIGNIEYYNLIN